MEAKERVEQERLLSRGASGSSSGDDETLREYELDDFEDGDITAESEASTHTPRWWRKRPVARRRTHGRNGRGGSGSSLFTLHSPRRRRSLAYRIARLLVIATYLLLSSVVICAIFFPSYSNPPARYLELRSRVLERGESANVNNEKVFIAASLYDPRGELLSGPWGASVLRLVEILGPDNVFLSIYENDPDEKAQEALDAFRKDVTCESAITTESLDLADFPHVTTYDGRLRLKRIAFLADVRNRALQPLEDTSSSAYKTRFDKLLYLNDVMFDPIDAANLLLSTNLDEQSGKTQYRAACAVDFINPFKFYDTFATRDLEGFETGVIFYPWFTSAGKAESRNDVLGQKDAVRVTSCWGGMVAFEAKWFQNQGQDQVSHSSNSSLRFRSETDTYWDSSECCLIHADLSVMDPSSLAPNSTGIYMNPYIRVAYSASVLSWLSFTKRFERLYTPINSLINWIANRPVFNERQSQKPGEEVVDRVWMWDAESLAAMQSGTSPAADTLHGRFKDVRRTALPGGFCGERKLLYINEDPSNGEPKWAGEKIPPGAEVVL